MIVTGDLFSVLFLPFAVPLCVSLDAIAGKSETCILIVQRHINNIVRVTCPATFPPLCIVASCKDVHITVHTLI